MGSLQPKQAVPDGRITGISDAAGDEAGWLDGLLEALKSKADASPHEQVRLRLTEVSFDAILLTLERAGADLDAAAAIALYRHWIDANIGISPLLYAAWFNLGVLFSSVGDRGNAAIAYGNTLALRPDMHAAAINLGLVLEAAGQPEQALATWHRAVQP